MKPDNAACQETGVVFNIQTLCLHDGPGIRTTVFLKGCTLSCDWCANPESIEFTPELGVNRSLCDGCRKCLPACPRQALRFDGAGRIRIDRRSCDGCGECVEVCQPGALVVYGKTVGVGDVFERICRDEKYYRGSGGGVTVSGGEPLAQAPFVAALFRLCRERRIHTCLETAGYVNSETLQGVLKLTDYVLYDLKNVDPEIRRNQVILRNARIVVESGIPMHFRMPLVPGVNDALDDIARTAHFIKGLGADLRLELLPYHALGLGKYRALDRPYALEGLKAPTPADVENVRNAFSQLGVECRVSR